MVCWWERLIGILRGGLAHLSQLFQKEAAYLGINGSQLSRADAKESSEPISVAAMMSFAGFEVVLVTAMIPALNVLLEETWKSELCKFGNNLFAGGTIFQHQVDIKTNLPGEARHAGRRRGLD